MAQKKSIIIKEFHEKNIFKPKDLKQKNLLQDIFDSFPFYMMLIDKNHHVLLTNEAVQSTLGIDPNKIIGMHYKKAVHGLNELYPGSSLEESIEKDHYIEKEFFNPDLKQWASSAIYPTRLLTKDGIPVYINMIFDINLKKKAEQELIDSEEQLKHALATLRKAFSGSIQLIASTVEYRDPYTAGHQRRVTDLARGIAAEMGLPKDKIDGIRMAGIIHDLGKISVPVEILSKPNILSDNEYELIKVHPQVAYDILKGVEFPWPVADIILQHHERIDGSGYPSGLSGEEILIEARIIAVADVIEAMASYRPYRPSLGLDKALEEISENRGILYDVEVVDASLKLFKEKNFKFRDTHETSPGMHG